MTYTFKSYSHYIDPIIYWGIWTMLIVFTVVHCQPIKIMQFMPIPRNKRQGRKPG